MDDLTFREHGAQRFRCALSLAEVRRVLDALSGLPQDVAGTRLSGFPGSNAVWGEPGPMWRIAAGLIGANAFPVRAVLFDKTDTANWSLGWHQDRTIVVRRRLETPGYGPWSVKAGLIHVAPPFELLRSMATLRLHLDPVDVRNAPLRIAPGSHKAAVAAPDVPAAVERHGEAIRLADTGDVWAYSTPIIHASRAADQPGRRRVLQVDFANRPLDGDLDWLGVGMT